MLPRPTRDSGGFAASSTTVGFESGDMASADLGTTSASTNAVGQWKEYFEGGRSLIASYLYPINTTSTPPFLQRACSCFPRLCTYVCHQLMIIQLNPFSRRAPPRSSCSGCRGHLCAACGSRTWEKVRPSVARNHIFVESKGRGQSYQKALPKTNPTPVYDRG